MKKYLIKHCDSKEIDWSLVPKLTIKETIIEEPLFPIEATAQLCWNENAIRVRMEAKEPEILARWTDDYSMPCEDSCLEMFFSPIYDDTKYFNFECNPNGATYLGIGHDRYDLERLHPDKIKELLSITIDRDEKSWRLSFSFPVEFIKKYFPEFNPRAGYKFRANFYKCGDDLKPTHELMWNPITNGNTDFHQPEFFGEVELTD